MTKLPLSFLIRLAVQSLSQPKVVMRQVLQFSLTRKQLVLMSILLVVFDLMFGLVQEILFPEMRITAKGLSQGVAPFFVFQLAAVFFSVIVIHRGGAQFGGKGSFDDCLKMVLWMNFVFFLAKFFVLAVSLVAEPVLGLFVVGIISFVQMIAYIMVVHKFDTVVPVIFGVFGAQLILFFFSIVLAEMLGLSVSVGAV